MRRPRPAIQPAVLRARLTHLRELAYWLRLHAGLGRDLRLSLARSGSPVWTPSEDLSFRRWIEAHGDEEARCLLAALDEALDEEYAELKAREELEGEEER